MDLFLACIDFETALVDNGQGAPPWVVFGWAIQTPHGRASGLVTRAGEWEGDCPPGYDEEEGVPDRIDPFHVILSMFNFIKQMKRAGHLARFINQNLPFDMIVAMHADNERMIPAVFDMYEEMVMEDCYVREMLIDLAAGYLGFVRNARNKKTGKLIKRKYDLADIARRRLNVEMDKTTWRLGYWELVETPLSRWPDGAKKYVTDDVHVALDVYLHQRAEVMEDIESGEVPDSIMQEQAHFAMALISAWGVRTDPAKVAVFKHQLELDLDVFKKALQRVGFIREGRVESKDKKAIEAYLVRVADMIGFELPRTDPNKLGEKARAKAPDGNIRQGAATIDDLLEAMNITFFTNNEDSGGPTEHEQALTMAHDVIQGRANAKVHFSAPKAEKKRKLKSKEDVGDYDDKEGSDDDEDIDVSQQPDELRALALLSYHTSTQKVLRTYIPPAEHGGRWPINAFYNPVLNTGRISCQRPNLTNLPKAPGVRECYVPRPGNVFASCDYEALELHTLAQACLMLLGTSRLAEALNDGVDPHLAMACDFLLDGIPYDEGKKIRKDETHPRYKEVVHARNIAKASNFGLPGGLGAKKFVAYCKQSGIVLTIPQAEEIKQSWLTMWPEMRQYFRHINDSMFEGDDEDEQGRPNKYATITQLVSGRVRGRTRYTAAANGYFQGLAADLAKHACYELAKACYVPGHNKVLYGSRTVVFVHDESIMEHPRASAHERAYEQARIMVEAGKPYCPDVPLKVDPCLMDCWTKAAVAQFDENKRLVPWTPKK